MKKLSMVLTVVLVLTLCVTPLSYAQPIDISDAPTEYREFYVNYTPAQMNMIQAGQQVTVTQTLITPNGLPIEVTYTTEEDQDPADSMRTNTIAPQAAQWKSKGQKTVLRSLFDPGYVYYRTSYQYDASAHGNTIRKVWATNEKPGYYRSGAVSPFRFITGGFSDAMLPRSFTQTMRFYSPSYCGHLSSLCLNTKVVVMNGISRVEKSWFSN